MEVSERFTGVVKIFYTLKGFGFITRQKGKDVFFHFQDILTAGADASVVEGDQVEFYIGSKDGKPRALKVRKLG